MHSYALGHARGRQREAGEMLRKTDQEDKRPLAASCGAAPEDEVIAKYARSLVVGQALNGDVSQWHVTQERGVGVHRRAVVAHP